MQLSFDAADRLVELVQARRGPVSATDAATDALRASLRTRGDRPLAPRRRRSGRGPAHLAGRLDPPCRSSGCGSAARGGALRRRRPRDHGPDARAPLASARSARSGSVRSSSPIRSRRSSTRACRFRRGDPDHRHRSRRDPWSAAAGGRGEAVPPFRRRRGDRRAQRPLRSRVSRLRGRAVRRAAHRLTRRRHRLARTAPARGADAQGRAVRRSPTSSACRPSRAIVRFPMRERPPRSS